MVCGHGTSLCPHRLPLLSSVRPLPALLRNLPHSCSGSHVTLHYRLMLKGKTQMAEAPDLPSRLAEGLRL